MRALVTVPVVVSEPRRPRNITPISLAPARHWSNNRHASVWERGEPSESGIRKECSGCFDIMKALPEMIVAASSVTFDSLSLDSGVRLAPVEVAYETYGTLNARKTNAILVLHAFSGDAHAAGISPETGKPGWWDNMIGPGKAFDTDNYFVICSNVLGGCRGTTGPSSVNPDTGCPYGMTFPVITIGDMVRLQKMLIDWFGIEKLLTVSGGSMGGMQALEWAVEYPVQVVSAIPIASTARHSAQQIAFNEVGRQAIMADLDWNGGNYYGKQPPARGPAGAGMEGQLT